MDWALVVLLWKSVGIWWKYDQTCQCYLFNVKYIIAGKGKKANKCENNKITKSKIESNVIELITINWTGLIMIPMNAFIISDSIILCNLPNDFIAKSWAKWD